MLQVHNILLLKMCNLSNILQTANIIFKNISLSINVLSHYNAFELYESLQPYRQRKKQIAIDKQRETRRQSNLEIAASNTSCNEALIMSFAHGLRPEFRFPNGLYIYKSCNVDTV